MHRNELEPSGRCVLSSGDTATVVIDIDNTIVDTALRKQQLLARRIGYLPDIAAVRQDYWLTHYLGPRDGRTSERFFRELDEPPTLAKYPAPPFRGAIEAVRYLASRGLCVVLLSNRPESLRDATIRELARLGLDADLYELYLAPTSRDGQEDAAIKASTIQRVKDNGTVVAVVGDRPDDIHAAATVGIPAVLLASTLNDIEVQALSEGDADSDFALCENWASALQVITELLRGKDMLDELRSEFTNQYDRWLGDIDNKCQTIVVIAAALAALAGHLLLEAGGHQLLREKIVLGGAFGASIFSAAYALRALTSRYSSGSRAGHSVPIGLRLWIGTLVGKPTSWTHTEDDATSESRRVREAALNEKRAAHLQFFYERYRTYDPGAIRNLRLLELRATNYEKLYAERCASDLLSTGLVLLLVWTIMHLL